MKSIHKKYISLLIALIMALSPALALAKPCCCVKNSTGISQNISQDGDEDKPCHEEGKNNIKKDDADKFSLKHEKKQCGKDCMNFSAAKYMNEKLSTFHPTDPEAFKVSLKDQNLSGKTSDKIENPPKNIL